MAVPEVGAGIRGEVVIGKAAADVDGHRSVWDAVVECRSVGIPVEVNGVLFEQVRPHDHPDVGEGEEHFIVLIECNQRRRHVAVHDSDILNLAGIDVSIKAAGWEARARWRCRGSEGSCGGVSSEAIYVWGQTHGAVVCKSPKRARGVCQASVARPIRRGRITGLQRDGARIYGIEGIWRLCAG